MATVQVRNVPDDVHRIHRDRAASAGLSLQEYLLAELVRSARSRSPAEVVAEVEQDLRRTGGDGFARSSSSTEIRRLRDSR